MKRSYILLALFLVAAAALIGTSRTWRSIAEPKLSFTEQCLRDGNMWHSMRPLRNGVELSGEERPGCMTANGLHHFSDEAEYRAAMNPGASSAALATEQIGEGMVYRLQFTLTDEDGAPELYREHDKYLHVILISRDMRHFAHMHPEDEEAFTPEAVHSGVFDLVHEFPAPGEYIVAVDYANRLKHESRTFRVTVPGEAESGHATYASPERVAGYDVSLEYGMPVPNEFTTLKFSVSKNGAPVTDLVPYLSAAMHVAVVKNDLSEFIHAHGEWHPPGYIPTPPSSSTTHVHTPPPSKFGPTVEAHVQFPSAGEYTIFAEFTDAAGTLVRAPFTLRVE